MIRKKYFNNLSAQLKPAFASLSSLPKKISPANNLFDEIKITDLPLIHHWPNDGGAFITLPQVYTEDITKPGIQHSNLGCIVFSLPEIIIF